MPLTIQDLQESSSPASYQRGQKYYEQGHVGKLTYRGHVYRARVRGSENYQVEINPDDHNDANCTCPAFFDADGWCKHMVAVGLSIIYSKNSAGSPATASATASKQVKKAGSTLPADIQHILHNLPDTEKNALLEELLIQFPDLHAALRIRYHENYDIPGITKSLQKYVNAVKRASSDQSYLKNNLQFYSTLKGQGADWPISEKASKARLQLVNYVYQQFDYIDDSAGKMQDICYQLLQQVIMYVNQSGPNGLPVLLEGFACLASGSELKYILLDLVVMQNTNPAVEAWWRTLLEQSNVRDPKETGLSRQQLQTQIAQTLGKSGNALFLKHLDDFEMVQHLQHLQAEYYYACRDWESYLKYSHADPDFLRFDRCLEAYTARQEWKELEALLKQALQGNIKVIYNRDSLTARYLQTLKKQHLQQDVIDHKMQEVYQLLLEKAHNKAEKISLLIKLKAYKEVAAIILTWWQKRLSGQSTYYLDNSSAVEKQMYEALQHISLHSAEDAIPLNRELLALERQRLESSKSNQYSNIQRLIENLKCLHQDDDIEQFRQFVNTRLPNRKKLVEWLAIIN